MHVSSCAFGLVQGGNCCRVMHACACLCVFMHKVYTRCHCCEVLEYAF
jgi:hypothetical protein